MRLALMIEGQEGVTWEHWLALAEACEQHGVEALFRSDHYLSPTDQSRVALDAWAVIPALASDAETDDLHAAVVAHLRERVARYPYASTGSLPSR